MISITKRSLISPRSSPNSKGNPILTSAMEKYDGRDRSNSQEIVRTTVEKQRSRTVRGPFMISITKRSLISPRSSPNSKGNPISPNGSIVCISYQRDPGRLVSMQFPRLSRCKSCYFLSAPYTDDAAIGRNWIDKSVEVVHELSLHRAASSSSDPNVTISDVVVRELMQFPRLSRCKSCYFLSAPYTDDAAIGRNWIPLRVPGSL
jgi:hypothetical protein